MVIVERHDLREDETIITPYYMRQLLQYGIKLGQSQKGEASPEDLLLEAEVCCVCRVVYFLSLTVEQRLVAELKALQLSAP